MLGEVGICKLCTHTVAASAYYTVRVRDGVVVDVCIPCWESITGRARDERLAAEQESNSDSEWTEQDARIYERLRVKGEPGRLAIEALTKDNERMTEHLHQIGKHRDALKEERDALQEQLKVVRRSLAEVADLAAKRNIALRNIFRTAASIMPESILD